MTQPVKLVPVPTPAQQANASTVDLLCDMLIKAQAGHVVEVIMVTICPHGGYYLDASGGVDFLTRLGALEMAKHELLAERAKGRS